MPEEDWELVRNDRAWTFGGAGVGMLRAALLFGSAAIALALIVVPMLEGTEDSYLAQSYPGDVAYPGDVGIDRTVTGSVTYKGTYTIRRSVLQETPEAECIIRANGSRTGSC